MGEQKSEIGKRNWRLVIVHMGETEDGLPDLDRFGLAGISLIQDPHSELYRSFGLEKGTFSQHFHPKLFLAGARARREGHRVGKIAGDGWQMPGMFVVENGKITHSHIARHIGDHADITTDFVR